MKYVRSRVSSPLIFFLPLLVFAFLTMGVVAPYAAYADVPWEGSGTETDPYLIADAKGLRALSQDVDSGNDSLYNSNFFKVTSDIDVSDEPWTPIGTYHVKPDEGSWFYHFQGTFDGGGHTITGVRITNDDSTKKRGSGHYVGLFGCVKNATLKNFIVEGEIEGGNGVAGIVGWAEGAVTLENIGNKAALASNVNSIGGVVGAATNNSTQLTLLGCFNRGNITVTGSNGAQVGGLVGIVQNNVRIVNCYNTGLITSPGTRVGGFYGYTANADASLVNCYSAASITGPETHFGVGAFGGEKIPNLQNCFYDSSLTSLTGINDPNQDPAELKAKSSAEMKANSFANELSGNTEASRKFVHKPNMNDGYPVLAWETDSEKSAAADSSTESFVSNVIQSLGLNGILWSIMALGGLISIVASAIVRARRPN